MHRQSQVYKFNSSYLITLDCCVAFEYINVFFFPLLSFVLPLRSAWCPEVLLHNHWTPRWVHVMGQQTERCSDVRCVSAQRRGKFFVHKSPQECPENTIIQACFWLLQFVKLCIVKHSPAGSTQSFSQSSHPEWVVALTADTRNTWSYICLIRRLPPSLSGVSSDTLFLLPTHHIYSVASSSVTLSLKLSVSDVNGSTVT